MEEDLDSSSKYYVISVLEAPAEGTQAASLKRKLWVERIHLSLVRQRYYDGGRLVSTIRYSNLVRVGSTIVPSGVEVERLEERYTIRLQYKHDAIAVDRKLKAGIFQIPFPPELNEGSSGKWGGGDVVGTFRIQICSPFACPYSRLQ